MDVLAAFEIRDDAPALVCLNSDYFFAGTENGALAAHVVAQGFHDFRVDEIEQRRARFDQRDLDAHGDEHRGVFESDHAAADDDQLARDFVHQEKLVAGDDFLPVEGNIAGMGGARTASDQHVRRVEQMSFRLALHLDRRGVEELRGAAQQLDSIAAELIADDSGFALDDLRDPVGQIPHRDAIFYDVIGAIERAVAKAGQMKDGLAQRLARNGTAVDANAADHVIAVDHGHALAELRRGDRGFLARRPAADHHEVVLNRLHDSSPAGFPRNRSVR